MTITGTWEAFKEFVAHSPDCQYATFCYTKTPAGRVAAILVNQHLEWRFPAAENVTVEWISRFAGASIEVVSWQL